MEHKLKRGIRRDITKPRLFGYAETTCPIVLNKWTGKFPPERNYTAVVIPVGTTVKAVMFSTFGDFGITDELEKNTYHLRLFPSQEGNRDPRKGVLTAEECLTNFRVKEQ